MIINYAFRAAAVALVASLTLVASGCAAEEITAPPTLMRSETPTADPTPTFDGLSDFDIACDAVVSDAAVEAVIGSHSPVAEPNPSPDYWGLNQAALMQDGALICSWGSTSEAASATVVALSDAAAFYERARPGYVSPEYGFGYTPVDLYDGALVQCLDGINGAKFVCTWEILAGDVWISIGLNRVVETDVIVPVPRENPDTSLKPFEPLVEGSSSLALVRAVVDSVVEAPHDRTHASTSALPACTTMLDLPSLEAATGTTFGRANDLTAPEAEGASTVSQHRLGMTMFAYSMERLGFARCFVWSSEHSWSAQITVVTGMAWTLAAPYGPPSGSSETVAGLGLVYEECYAGEGGEGCVVSVLADEVLISIDLLDTQDVQLARGIADVILSHI